jgi:hypothetical protein
MCEFNYDPETPGTIWLLDIGHTCPVVHEHRADGTVITHVRPRGGKSALLNELMDEILRSARPSEQ